MTRYHIENFAIKINRGSLLSPLFALVRCLEIAGRDGGIMIFVPDRVLIINAYHTADSHSSEEIYE